MATPTPPRIPRAAWLGMFRLWNWLGMFRLWTLLGMFRPWPSVGIIVRPWTGLDMFKAMDLVGHV